LIQEERFGKLRPVCPSCGWIYFTDPKVAVAALIERPGQVLLVRRAVDPLRGKWSLPAGFVDAGEDPIEAVCRECLEETGLTVRVTGLLDVIYGLEHPRGAHIVIVYRVEMLDGQLQSGDDVDSVAFFDLDHLPELAFRTTQQVLFGLRKNASL
jgi:ADP-ribose pyrophosphatase YjhB (NUDIX family)